MPEYIERETALKFRLNAHLRPKRLTAAQATADAIAEYIKAIPAADVKPVIHAHWYADDGCAYCSNCRNNFKKAILKAVKFCPMCGAKMDGGTEE